MKSAGHTCFRAAVTMAACWLLTAASSFAEVRQEDLWWLPKNYAADGDKVDFLFNVIFWLTTVVFVVVTVVQLYFMVKYRARKGVKAIYSHGNNTLEIVWTTIPSCIFIGLVVYSNHIWNSFHNKSLIPADAITLDVVAEQYGWNIRYPGPDGVLGKADYQLMSPENKLGLDPSDEAGKDDFVVYGEMTVPVGKAVKLILRSRDVIHAFYVPQFRLYQDVVPGRAIDWVWFQAIDKAQLELACSQLCGAGHYNMKAKLNVVSPEDFTKWEADHEKKTASAAPPSTGRVAAVLP